MALTPPADDPERRRAARAARRASLASGGADPDALGADPASDDGATGTPSGKKAKKVRKKKGPIREWVDAVVFALVVMLVVRTLFIDQFRIPSPSMEKSLLVGDFLFVSKLHYGARTPISLGIPFTKIHIDGIQLPGTRLPGFSHVKRGDAVVFNWPGMPDTPPTLPVDRREFYIKRVMGLPGETLRIDSNVMRVDGVVVPELPTFQHFFLAFKRDAAQIMPESRIRAFGGTLVQETPEVSVINGTQAVQDSVAALPYVERVIRYRSPLAGQLGFQGGLFPAEKNWTVHDFGPITMPKMGVPTTFTPENVSYLVPTIARYEGHTAERMPDGTVQIDGVAAASYTFSQDYYFMMGDNRDDSQDSRFWGFVPYDHVVGKAVLVYLSFDTESGPVPTPRFRRIGTVVR